MLTDAVALLWIKIYHREKYEHTTTTNTLLPYDFYNHRTVDEKCENGQLKWNLLLNKEYHGTNQYSTLEILFLGAKGSFFSGEKIPGGGHQYMGPLLRHFKATIQACPNQHEKIFFKKPNQIKNTILINQKWGKNDFWKKNKHPFIGS